MLFFAFLTLALAIICLFFTPKKAALHALHFLSLALVITSGVLFFISGNMYFIYFLALLVIATLAFLAVIIKITCNAEIKKVENKSEGSLKDLELGVGAVFIGSHIPRVLFTFPIAIIATGLSIFFLVKGIHHHKLENISNKKTASAVFERKNDKAWISLR